MPCTCTATSQSLPLQWPAPGPHVERRRTGSRVSLHYDTLVTVVTSSDRPFLLSCTCPSVSSIFSSVSKSPHVAGTLGEVQTVE